MLILAGVTLSITLGESGIFSQSKLAMQKYENAKSKEEKELQDVSNLISNLGVASNRDEPKSNEEKIEELETTIDTLKKQLENLTGLVSGKGGINPPGTIISYMGTNAPKGYLICDGSTKNISDFPDLAKQINDNFGQLDYWGGDGINTFALPNLQGEFLRGYILPDGVGMESGIGTEDVGRHQASTRHVNFSVAASNANLHTATQGLGRYNVDKYDGDKNTTWNYYTVKGTWTPTDSEAIRPYYTSRPTNTSVLYCIKY